jgi:micrococcal nuclease
MYEYNAKVVEVIDADSLILSVDLGFKHTFEIRVRLARINAPEIHGVKKDSLEYTNGMASMRFVQDFLKGTNNNVRIVTSKDKQEKYGRYLAEVFFLVGAEWISLNKTLLDKSLAVEFMV